MKIEVYSDVVCPWCYVGERRLFKAIDSLPNAQDVEIVFRPYQLDPTAPSTAVPLRESLARRYGARSSDMLSQVTSAAEGEDISMDWDNALSVNTRRAQRLIAFALQHHGATIQRALVERLFAMHFTEGGNVGDIEQLIAAASEAGVDAARARELLESDEGEAEFGEALAHAHEIGVQSVPTFVINGRYAIVGAQPVSAIVGAIKQIEAKV